MLVNLWNPSFDEDYTTEKKAFTLRGFFGKCEKTYSFQFTK